MATKKVFSTKMDDDLIKALKHLAVDEDRNVMDLLEEAVNDLLKKYGAGSSGQWHGGHGKKGAK